MRILEILSADELQQLERLIYANVYKALAIYHQQQRLANIQRQHPTNIVRLKPQTALRKTQLARKTQRPPYAAPPKPLPKPQQQIAPQTSTPNHYNPIKAPKPLPAPTRSAIKQTSQAQGETVKNFGNVDHNTRTMLPPSKRGTPEWALFNK